MTYSSAANRFNHAPQNDDADYLHSDRDH